MSKLYDIKSGLDLFDKSGKNTLLSEDREVELYHLHGKVSTRIEVRKWCGFCYLPKEVLSKSEVIDKFKNIKFELSNEIDIGI